MKKKQKKKYDINSKEIFKKVKDILKNKKIVIIAIIILIICIVIVLLLSSQNKKKELIPIDEVFTVENYKSIKTKRTNKKISSGIYEIKKYKTRETKDDIELNRLSGKVLYIRSKTFNANVFQAKVLIKITKEKNEPELMQVQEAIDQLKIGTFNYIGLPITTTPLKEKLTGKSNLPLRESIYLEKYKYNSTYMGPNSDKYDINFYMDGKYLVCELVKFLELKKK